MTNFIQVATENVDRDNISGGFFDTLLGTYNYDDDSHGYGEFIQTDLTGQNVVGWKVRLMGYGDGPLDWRVSVIDPANVSQYFAVGSFAQNPEGIVLGGTGPLDLHEYRKVITEADAFFGIPSNPSGYMYSFEHAVASLNGAPVGGFYNVNAEISNAGPGTFTLAAFELIFFTSSVLPPRRQYPYPTTRVYPPPPTNSGTRFGSAAIL